MTEYARRLVETAPPVNKPLSLSDVKTFLRIDHEADDDLLDSLILTAGEICEKYADKSLIHREYSLFLDQWPGASSQAWWDGVREGANIVQQIRSLELPKPPLYEVLGVYIYDAEGSPSSYALENFFADNTGLPGRLMLKSGVIFPSPGRSASGIEIQFIAGYGATTESIPMMLRQGMRQIVAYLYENRGDGPEQALALSGAKSFFDPFRVIRL